MSYAIALRRMTPIEAANEVWTPQFHHFMAGITADQAAQQAMPKSEIRSTAGFTQAVYNDIVNAASTGNFSSFNPTQCGGISPSGARIVNTASGLALQGLSTALSVAGVASTIAAPVTFGASLLVGLFSSMFAHHAAAIAKERQVICASVPAASDSLKAIDQAVRAGTITPAQGIDALNNLLSSFQQTVAPIIKMDSSHCNAACVWVKQLEAIVIKKSSDYQDLETVAAAAAQPVSGSPSAAAVQNQGQISQQLSSVPTWAWIAAAAGIFLVMK